MSIDCNEFDGKAHTMCVHYQDNFKKQDEEIDELRLQIYIISGVFGGVALILIFITIALAALLNRIRQSIDVGSSDAKPKPTPDRGLSSKSVPNGNSNLGNAYPRHPPPHSYAHSPKTPAEEELAQLGFSAYTGEHPSRLGLSTSPSVAGSTGGVRVLPRNPPSGGFRNPAYNDGFM